MKELCQNIWLSNPIENAAIVLDNLQIKTSNKIVTYNIDFMKYLF